MAAIGPPPASNLSPLPFSDEPTRCSASACKNLLFLPHARRPFSSMLHHTLIRRRVLRRLQTGEYGRRAGAVKAPPRHRSSPSLRLDLLFLPHACRPFSSMLHCTTRARRLSGRIPRARPAHLAAARRGNRPLPPHRRWSRPPPRRAPASASSPPHSAHRVPRAAVAALLIAPARACRSPSCIAARPRASTLAASRRLVLDSSFGRPRRSSSSPPAAPGPVPSASLPSRGFLRVGAASPPAGSARRPARRLAPSSSASLLGSSRGGGGWVGAWGTPRLNFSPTAPQAAKKPPPWGSTAGDSLTLASVNYTNRMLLVG